MAFGALHRLPRGPRGLSDLRPNVTHDPLAGIQKGLPVAAPQDRDKALDMVLANIDKQFGKGSVMRLGDETRAPIEVIPTGAISLDVALGIGGLPRGRVVEIYGPESSGKTTVALHAVANAQKAGGIAAFIDAEHALDPEYAKALGVDTDALLVSQPDTGEQALEIMDMLIRSNALDIIVIDSVAALVPRAEIEGEMGDSHVGLQARLMSQALRKITGALSNSGTTAIFINQLREKIGVFFGSPETTTGGKALKFYASVRLDIRRIETLKDGQEAVGSRTRVKVVKNKCLAGDTKVFDTVTGQVHTIAEIVDNRLDVNVMGADKAGMLEVRPVTSWFDQGEQDLVRLVLRGGTSITATPDHQVLTERGWVELQHLLPADRVATPRVAMPFGVAMPFSADEARLIGYLVGDGYVGGKTPCAFINAAPDLIADVERLANERGCKTTRKEMPGATYLSMSHRPGEKNGVLELARRAGIWGKLAWEKSLPAEVFQPELARDVAANMIFGLLESDGYVSLDTGGCPRVGFTTTSAALAEQIRWLLLRFGVTSSVKDYDPTEKRPSLVNGRPVYHRRPCYEVRVSGVDNVAALLNALPSWGPRTMAGLSALAAVADRPLHGSQAGYLPADVEAEILGHLSERKVTAREVAGILGAGQGSVKKGIKELLGTPRLRRDRVQRLADALDDSKLRTLLETQLTFRSIRSVEPAGRGRTFDVEVEQLHNLVADGVVVHNCAPPFKQAEFDVMWGQGISREGSLIDLGVDNGIVRKSGAWYTYEGDQLGQGKENSRAFLRDNPDLANEIEKKIKEKLGIGAQLDAPADGEGDPDAPINVVPVDF